MITLELRYVGASGASINFNNLNSILASNDDIISMAEKEKPKISVTGAKSNPVLLFFDEQQMYRFSREIHSKFL